MPGTRRHARQSAICASSGLLRTNLPLFPDRAFQTPRAGSAGYNRRVPLFESREAGLYCAAGDFHVDPKAPVKRAVITHAGRALPGSQSYLTARPGEALLRTVLPSPTAVESIEYGAAVRLGDVCVSLHPAGHILGSSQVRVEHHGEVWILASDYKLAPDPTCTPFEPLRCHTFITGAAFALPIFRWPSPASIFDAIRAWWLANRDAGKTSVLFTEPLGDAQRLLAGLHIPVQISEDIERINAVYGMNLSHDPQGILLVAPGSEVGSGGTISKARVSGWMRIRGTRRRQSLDRGFVLSNCADWTETLQVADATNAETVWVTHGFRTPLVRWLQEHGRNAVGVES